MQAVPWNPTPTVELVEDLRGRIKDLLWDLLQADQESGTPTKRQRDALIRARVAQIYRVQQDAHAHHHVR